MVGKMFLGRYEIIKKLGVGGMAVVYKAYDKVLNRTVTIKVLLDQYTNNNDFVIRFRKEAQAIAALSDSNVVNVFDVGYEEGMHYLIMEYLEGETLKNIIRSRGVMEVDDVLDVSSQILNGLSHAHSYGVIHRDIKPQNIMLCPGQKVKIMDFGLALNTSEATITYDGAIFGSVYYIAPEMAQKGKGDQRSDIYSLAIVMYEMLTGKLPYVGDTPISIALQHIEGNYVRINKLNPDIPVDVCNIVEKAMAKDPFNRYQSADEMLADIKKVKEKNTGNILSVTPVSALSPEKTALYRNNDELEKTIPPKSRSAQAEEDMESEEDKKAYNANKKKKTMPRKLKYGLIGVSVAVVAFIIYMFFSLFGGGGEVEVPMVTDMPLEQAAELIKDSKLDYSVVRVDDKTVDPNTVISQDITPGNIVKKGRIIELTVTNEGKMVKLKSLIGMTQKEAEQELLDINLTFEVKTTYSSSIPKGQVISHSPGPQTNVIEGSQVILNVSKGEEVEKVTVPEVTGRSLADAKILIEGSGLAFGGSTEKYSDTVANGLIISQSIFANSKVDKGTAITVVVSKGQEIQAHDITLTYTVPTNYNSVSYSIIVNDESGRKTISNGIVNGGDIIKKNVTVKGNGKISVYLDDIEAYWENF